MAIGAPTSLYSDPNYLNSTRDRREARIVRRTTQAQAYDTDAHPLKHLKPLEFIAVAEDDCATSYRLYRSQVY